VVVVVVVVLVVLVVEPGAVLVVVVDGVFSGGTPAISTGRNRSSAVCPTRRSAWQRSLTPGRSPTMSLPCRETSGSVGPKLSTRLRMMSSATSSELALYLPIGENTTDTPPRRSRPRTGVWPPASVARNRPTMTTTEETRKITLRRMSAFLVARAVGHIG